MSRGGARAGAGRKPSTLKGVLRRLPRDSAALILNKIKAQEKWIKLANSEDERIMFETMKYLTDRAYGKPTQAVEHSGAESVQTIQVAVQQLPPRDKPGTLKPDFG